VTVAAKSVSAAAPHRPDASLNFGRIPAEPARLGEPATAVVWLPPML
jgi:hypothetical protein